MEFHDQLVAVTEPQGPLPQALSEAFVREGATVEWIARAADLDEYARAHRAPDALIVPLPQLSMGPFTEFSEAAWQDALQGELWRAIQVLRAVGARMAERRMGSILVVGTLAGTTGFPQWALTSAVEGALVALMRSLACEWATQNVRINYLACGAVAGDWPVAAEVDSFAARTPLGRLAKVDEIAQAALYLASGRASFTTGSVILADGGWSAWGLPVFW